MQKALKRLAGDTAASPLSQLVMWHLAAGLDWNTIGQLSARWSNRYELALARDFVEHLDTLPTGETGRLQFQVSSKDEAAESMAAELTQTLQGKVVLGLRAELGIPNRPEAPSVGCRDLISSSISASRPFLSPK